MSLSQLNSTSNYAILDYLYCNGHEKTFKSMEEELNLTYVNDGKQKYSGILEKKWLSVIRLQKKVFCSSSDGGYIQVLILNNCSIC